MKLAKNQRVAVRLLRGGKFGPPQEAVVVATHEGEDVNKLTKAKSTVTVMTMIGGLQVQVEQIPVAKTVADAPKWGWCCATDDFAEPEPEPKPEPKKTKKSKKTEKTD